MFIVVDRPKPCCNASCTQIESSTDERLTEVQKAAGKTCDRIATAYAQMLALMKPLVSNSKCVSGP